jgi:hypothetical protein
VVIPVVIHMITHHFFPILQWNTTISLHALIGNTMRMCNINCQTVLKNLVKNLIKLIKEGPTNICIHIPGVLDSIMDSLNSLELNGDYQLKELAI